MNISPLVSIGMPVFNGADYIEQALDSLLSQTYENFEIIISDNCSTDSTYEICEKFALKDKRVRLLKQLQNMGPLFNFGFVLQQARGEYYMWAAHDDVWDKHWLTLAVSNFDDDMAMVTSEIIGMNIHNEIISTPLKFDFRRGRTLRLIEYFLLPESHGKANMIYSLLRTDVAKKFHFPEIKGFHGFDMHFVFFMLGQGGCAFIEGKSLYKRVPEVQYQTKEVGYLANIYNFVVRNIYYLGGYVKNSQNIFDKLFIILLLPVKMLAILFDAGQSLSRRFLKMYK
jgi:glycosyltransferase involved in cell wall biosynthesis